MDVAEETQRAGFDAGKGRYRVFHGTPDRLITALTAGLALFCILNVSGVFFYAFHVMLLPERVNAIFVVVVLILTFLYVPARKGDLQSRIKWYDILFLAGGLVGTLYMAINAQQLAYWQRILATEFEVVIGIITIVVLMEAVRRFFGWAVVTMVAIFFLYAKFGYLIPGTLNVYYSSWSRLMADIYLSTGGIFGNLVRIANRLILPFLAFGVFFIISGGGQFFLKIALALTGHMTGGPAKAAVIGSALFGMISGNPGADVMVTGSVSIPMMKNIGYKAHYAGAVEAIASTGGVLTPPIMGGVAFVMAEMLGVRYAYIALIAIVPAILYYISVYSQVHLQAVKMGIKKVPRAQLPSIKQTIKEGWEFFIPFVVLIVLLFVLHFPAAMAAIYSTVVIIAVSWFRRQHRINYRVFINGLSNVIKAILPVANIIALIGIIIGVLSITGLGPKLSSALVTLSGGSPITLVALAGLACYIMGMGVSTLPSYILLGVLVAPALNTLGIPAVVTHFYIFYLTCATYFTPPYCTTAYVASILADAPPFKIGWQAMRLGIVCYLVPFAIVVNPALILIGNPAEIALAIGTAIIGVFSLAIGIEGWLFSKVRILQRVLFLVGGVCIFVPNWELTLAGAVTLAGVYTWHWLDSRRLKAAIATN